MDVGYPYIAFKFEVRLEVEGGDQLGLANPLCELAFAECDGLEASMEPKVIKEGGNNTEQPTLVGRVTYSNLTLKRGMTGNLDMWKWFRAATMGHDRKRGATAHGTVVVKDAQGTPRLRFKLEGCLPVKLRAPALNAKDGLIAIEEATLAYSSMTVEAIDGGEAGDSSSRNNRNQASAGPGGRA